MAKFTWEGQHVWSRAFAASVSESAVVNTVSTDALGNVFLAGRTSQETHLGDGALGESMPFIAKYTAGGSFVWKRAFHGNFGAVSGVKPLGQEGAVVFNANLGGRFTFGGTSYLGGVLTDEVIPANVSGFTGTLSATGTDGWIRDHRFPANQLVTGSDGSITLVGNQGVFDLGGGILGNPVGEGPAAFLVHYSATGEHLWSRSFDRNMRDDGYEAPVIRAAPQPGGAVLIGTPFSKSFLLDGAGYSPRGAWDLFFFQLKP